MELLAMNETEKNHSELDEIVVNPREPADGVLAPPAKADGQASLRHFGPGGGNTVAMSRHSAYKRAGKNQHSNPHTGPTWGHLLGRIFLGLIEILIPLAFIVGMTYWRAPWLFWAVVHFLKGEPILNF